ncbi:HTH-type transcriptional regulator ImmR [Lentilactobacillus sunkii]|jgi:transcriptional regulator with XRE-family HTH domain|uniref:HTH-type transcriptional regulator ImmR n=1 Tax=Lentilactobacillus sunkii TaxID=481719 RepID=A0A1E7XCR3_9LACO|nr:helix-turn-helix transcriptional regulator [Lentilactobacillus sunkii]OFA10798.1 HTH-type transcriptional regulator ImmR [Lentilactobacillus sunkii]
MTRGQRIAQLRQRKNMSQSELAKALHVSPSTVGMWETDQRAIKDDVIVQLADFFDVTTDYLLGRKVDDGLTVAAHQDPDVTPEMQKEIDEYIEFKKAQYRKAHQNKED